MYMTAIPRKNARIISHIDIMALIVMDLKVDYQQAIYT